MKRLSRSRTTAGFSLIELIVVMLIITVLAGVTLPMASKLFDREAQKATRGEMATLGAAVELYFEDTAALPATLDPLLVDPGLAGWAGPYVSGGVQQASSAASDFHTDGWTVAYQVTVAGDRWTLTSAGPDRATGSSDDLVLVTDVTAIRRRQTVERLRVINLAIQLYNEDWLSPPPPTASDPLSDAWQTARAQLVGRNYLSNAADYAADGWGDDFVRSGSSGPVTAVESLNIGP